MDAGWVIHEPISNLVVPAKSIITINTWIFRSSSENAGSADCGSVSARSMVFEIFDNFVQSFKFLNKTFYENLDEKIQKLKG